MDNNELVMIVLAFFIGFMWSDMMKQICDNQLVEGFGDNDPRESPQFLLA